MERRSRGTFAATPSRYYCKICNCWLANHVRNIAMHEESARHKGNVQRKMRHMVHQNRVNEEEARQLREELSRVEAVARSAHSPAPATLRPARCVSPSPAPSNCSSEDTAEKSNAVSVAVRGPVSLAMTTKPYGESPCDTQANSSNNAILDESHQVYKRMRAGYNSCASRSAWVASLDPQTRKPVWVNTYTNEVRSTDPDEAVDKLASHGISVPRIPQVAEAALVASISEAQKAAAAAALILAERDNRQKPGGFEPDEFVGKPQERAPAEDAPTGLMLSGQETGLGAVTAVTSARPSGGEKAMKPELAPRIQISVASAPHLPSHLATPAKGPVNIQPLAIPSRRVNLLKMKTRLRQSNALNDDDLRRTG